MLRDPRRDDHTICTAVAAEAVFASAQIRHSAGENPQLTTLGPSEPAPVIKGRFKTR